MHRLLPIAAVAFVFLVYWAGGGDFKRGSNLAVTIVLAVLGGGAAMAACYDCNRTEKTNGKLLLDIAE